MRAIIILVVSTFLLATTMAWSDINVEPIVIDTYVAKNKPPVKREDLRIINEDQLEKAYVSIDLKRIENPGTAQEKEIDVTDPKAAGIYVSPRKLVIPPGGFRNVRVGFLQTPTISDNVYRIVVVPSLSLQEQLDSNLSAGVRVLVAYGVLVIQRPAQPKADITLVRSGNTITVKNSGNTSAEMIDAKQCARKNSCTPIDFNKRLYAGNTWTFEAPQALPVEFTENVGSQYNHVKTN